MKISTCKLAVWSLSLLLLACTAVYAQVTGTILGTVLDPTDRGVPGANITITDVNRGTTKTAVSDESGSYNVPFLPPGNYRVAVETAGFKRSQSAELVLNVDDKRRVDFKLEVGSVSESIDVTAAAPLVRAESAELGEVITRGAVEQLPLNGRNFAQLVYLVPGVTTGQAGENLSGLSTFNPRAGSNFNALGSQGNANGWLVDGISDNEYTFNTVIVQPSVESIQEFKVLTGTFSAEFGRGAGVVTTQTKSGSNGFHGSAFEFHRNSYLDARNYFNSKTLTSGAVNPQTPFRRHQFGASSSGPIIKNRTFFFADYYGWREFKGQTYVNSVPTAQERAGNFSDWNQNGKLLTIYNPTTTRVVNGQTIRDAFPGNAIPASMINPVSANAVSVYPLPNQPGTTNNFISSANRIVNDNGFNARVDHRISDKDSAFIRYSFEHFNLNSPQGQTACCLPANPDVKAKFDLGDWVAGPQTSFLRTSGMALNETHIFSPTLVNEFIGGYMRFNPKTFQSDYGHNVADKLGVTGINFAAPATTGIPGLTPTGFTGLSGGPNMAPVNPRDTIIQAGDTLSKTIGAHSLKFGYRYIRNQLSPYDHTNTRGAINFGLNFSNDPSTNTGGSGIASMLMGWTTSGSQGVMIDVPYMSSNEHATFFQDDWKITRRLTLNMGLRWDIFTPDKEIHNHLANFNLGLRNMFYAGVDGTSNTAGRETQYKNLGPRFGLAWDPFGNAKTVIRAGYGRTFIQQQGSATGMVDFQIPWIIARSYSAETYPLSMSAVSTIAKPFTNDPVQIQPKTTAALNAANPNVIGNNWENLTPNFQSWTLNVERQLSDTTVLEVAYAGSRGIHLLYCYNPNEVQPGPGTQASRRLIPELSNMSSINECEGRNMSNYHGLQGKLSKRLAKGVQYLLSYTWARALDYGGSSANGGGQVGGPQTVTNIKGTGYGPSGFNISHRFVSSWLVELPFGKDKRFLNQGVAGKIFGGIEVDGILTMQTGLPETITMANGVNNGAPSWPNRIGSGNLSNPDPYQWWDIAGFATPTANTYGNSSRGVLYQPGFKNVDLSALRRFRIREGMSFQVRMDAFNALNAKILGAPGATWNPSAPAGTNFRINTTNQDSRDMQLSLRLQW